MGPLIAALLALASPAPAAEPAAGAKAPASAPATPPQRRFVYLKSGVYDCELRGMVCAACADAITHEVSRVDGVEKAEVDFERKVLRVTVKPRRTLRVDSLKRALGRAWRLIDLGEGFSLGEIRYVP